MHNILLQKLADTKNRKFPLVYKHIEETISLKEVKEIEAEMVFISPMKDKKSECLDYYKPISKSI